MRKLIYLLFICTIFSLSSCSEYSEEIWINADGSGKYEMSQDFSDMLPFIEMGIESAKQRMAEKEEGEEPEDKQSEGLNPDQLMALMATGKLDTVISMESIIKNAYEKDGKVYSKETITQEMFKLIQEDDEFKGTEDEKKRLSSFFTGLMKVNNRIQYDQEFASLKNTLYQKFDDPSQMLFGNLPDLIEIVGKYADKGEGKLNDPNTKAEVEKMKDAFPTYELTKNTLKVRRKAMELDSDDPETAQGMGMMKGMMGNSTYTMKIHVPGKVKKVSQAGAKFEGSTVTWTMPALDMYDTTKDLNLDIKFKPKKGIVYQ